MTVDDTPGDHVAVRSRRHTLSIRSILLLMLLAVSVGSNVVVGVIGYVNGTDSLKQAAYDRLTEVRDSRAREVQSLFSSVEDSLLLASRDSAIVDAEVAFSQGLDTLDAQGAAAAPAAGTSGGTAPGSAAATPPTAGVLTADQEAALAKYFTDDFGPKLDAASQFPVDASSFIPTSSSARYLLYHYLVAPGDGTSVTDAGDGSAWSAAHAKFDDYLKRTAKLLDFGDVVLINSAGRVVYTANSGVDLGASLVNGPYSFTSLATTFDTAMSQNRLDSVVFSDYAPYAPAFDAPTSWVVTPLAGGDTIVGALAVQLPEKRIDDIMTGGGNWEQSGLGKTGEAYLVGSDANQTMRSISRPLAEDPASYQALALQAGVPADVVTAAAASGQTLLLQSVKTDAVTSALQGQTGTVISGGYLGTRAVSAYAPVALPSNLKWVIVAQIDASEAFAPVDDFTKKLVISSAVLVAVVSLLSVILSQLLVRPLRRLRDAARRIASGEEGVQVEAGDSDELADVAAAFNDMSHSLQLRANLLEEQQTENQRLLHTLMPENVAKRYREGAKTIVEEHQEVTVLFADIIGFEDYGRGLDSEKALDVLNDIFRAFDDAAEEHGVERVRSTRQGYLASCGLAVPRVDNARRAVEFALDLQRILDRFGAQQGVTLSVRAGLDTGTVTSGLVGRSSVVYDLWGDAVSLAFRLQGGANEAGIFVTQRVVDKISENLPFTDSGVVETTTGWQRVWRIDPKAVAPRA